MNDGLKIKNTTRVWVCPTDTIYGLSARVDDHDAIERIKKIKGGRENKRFIVLISDIAQLKEMFGIVIKSRHEDFLNKIWPGPVTVIFQKANNNDTIAVRLPDYPALREFIREVGPIVSTSANKSGMQPVKTVRQAMEIFGGEVDEYIDAGELNGEASTIVKIMR